MNNIRFMHRVPYQQIEDYLRLGWIAYEPNHFDYMHCYGIFMSWICDCPPPKVHNANH